MLNSFQQLGSVSRVRLKRTAVVTVIVCLSYCFYKTELTPLHQKYNYNYAREIIAVIITVIIIMCFD